LFAALLRPKGSTNRVSSGELFLRQFPIDYCNSGRA
jgi:hypothetical protein